MKISSALANRLGNRESNQDRLNIYTAKDCVLLVIADGMGGHSGGELAADITLDTLAKHFHSTAKPIRNPQAFLGLAIESAHQNILKARKQGKRTDPRTTCIACLLQDGGATWAHVGDSRLYLLRDNKLVVRTRDHSYVEELHQQGQISEADMLSHPMRNYLTECLGGDRSKPTIAYGKYENLETNDILLLCSDGFWSQLDERQLLSITAAGDLDARLDELAGIAEQRSYPQSDNISAIAVRWFNSQPGTGKSPGKPGDMTGRQNNSKMDNPVDDAIDAITSALEQYRDELKS